MRGHCAFTVLLLIASFIVINAAGLCVTYGWVQFG